MSGPTEQQDMAIAIFLVINNNCRIFSIIPILILKGINRWYYRSMAQKVRSIPEISQNGKEQGRLAMEEIPMGGDVL